MYTYCISYRRQNSEQGVKNPLFIGNVAPNKHCPIYEEIKEAYDHSGQPHTADDVDRLSIKSDDVTNTCKSSEPLPPPRQKKNMYNQW